MSKLHAPHRSDGTPPRSFSQTTFVPVVVTLKGAYALWQKQLPHIAKTERRTLGEKIDSLLLETLEYSFRASYLPMERKVGMIDAAIVRLDLAKFFLHVGWEIKMLSDTQFTDLSIPLAEASKMLVAWKGYVGKKTPPGGGER